MNPTHSCQNRSHSGQVFCGWLHNLTPPPCVSEQGRGRQWILIGHFADHWQFCRGRNGGDSLKRGQSLSVDSLSQLSFRNDSSGFKAISSLLIWKSEHNYFKGVKREIDHEAFTMELKLGWFLFLHAAASPVVGSLWRYSAWSLLLPSSVTPIIDLEAWLLFLEQGFCK